MNIQSFQTSLPVLFLIFNRPEIASETFAVIKDVKPKELFIACDGPRADKLGEDELVRKTRNAIEKMIDWDCDIKRLYREDNLGCQRSVSGSIDWFFKNVEKGVILEDDCLASPSFFRYCEELLDRYEDDFRVMSINGTCLTPSDDPNFNGESYCFSRYSSSWGWATWANRWSLFDVKMSNYQKFKEKNIIKDLFDDFPRQNFWKEIFQDVYDGKINSWAYIWSYTCFINNGLSCAPRRNLVSNIGFGGEGTHTQNKGDKMAEIPIFDLDFPLKHPEFIVVNKKIDRYIEKNAQRATFFRVLFFSFLKKIGLFYLAKSVYIKMNNFLRK